MTGQGEGVHQFPTYCLSKRVLLTTLTDYVRITRRNSLGEWTHLNVPVVVMNYALHNSYFIKSQIKAQKYFKTKPIPTPDNSWKIVVTRFEDLEWVGFRFEDYSQNT